MSSKTGEKRSKQNGKKKRKSSGLFTSTTAHTERRKKQREGNKQQSIDQIGYDEQEVSLSKSDKVWREESLFPDTIDV